MGEVELVEKAQIFLAGFLSNACIWRLQTGDMEDFIFPFSILLLTIISLMLDMA